MGRYQFCPHVLLRRVKIKAEFPTAVARKTVSWEGRLTVVLTRWPEDDFYVATVPRMGLESFAVGSTAVLEEGLTRFVEAWGARHNVNDLSLYVSRTYEYLEIMEVDAELPTVLPSKVPRPRRQRKKKKRRVMGPARGPSSSAATSALEGGDVDWAPPVGQDGSGRTALNDKFGY